MLRLVGSQQRIIFKFNEMLVDKATIDAIRVPLSNETSFACKQPDSILVDEATIDATRVPLSNETCVACKQ